MDGEPTTAPPQYSEPSEFPPDYSAGTSYSIGSHTINSPLVRINHVKAHLCLLSAIHDLKAIVMAGEDTRIPSETRAMDSWQRWSWFAGLAVERFQRWIVSARFSPLTQWVQEELPPVDVLMVWHAYMLNPLWYAEDLDRNPMLEVLKSLSGRLLSSLVEVEDISLHIASGERRDRWMEQTHTPFDPLDAMMVLKSHSIDCPQCTTQIECPFINADSTGYLQRDFSVQCTRCGFVLTREHLGAVKFARDLTLDPKDPEDVARYGDGVCLAGTLCHPLRGIARVKAEAIKVKLQHAYPLDKPTATASKWEWEQHILQATAYSMKAMKASTLSALSVGGYNVQRVLSAYADDRPFSLDLVGAVVRQSTFVDQLRGIQWLEPGHFGEDAEDDLVLSHAIARYHAFLDLIAYSPKALFVPTLDIDLIWHTHQMMGDMYNAHCAKYLHSLIDHYDRVEENNLAYCFDLTCRAWRDRYGLPYTYCGCPLPGDKIGERLSRLKQRLRNPLNPTGDLVPLQREDAILATHVSEHNAFPVPGTENVREQRLGKVNRRQARDRKKGHNVTIHDPPFLRLLPIYKGPSGVSTVAGDAFTETTWIPGAGGGNDGYTVHPAGGIPYGGEMIIPVRGFNSQ